MRATEISPFPTRLLHAPAPHPSRLVLKFRTQNAQVSGLDDGGGDAHALEPTFVNHICCSCLFPIAPPRICLDFAWGPVCAGQALSVFGLQVQACWATGCRREWVWQGWGPRLAQVSQLGNILVGLRVPGGAVPSKFFCLSLFFFFFFFFQGKF